MNFKGSSFSEMIKNHNIINEVEKSLYATNLTKVAQKENLIINFKKINKTIFLVYYKHIE